MSLPPGYPRIKQVSSFHELLTTPFADGVNAMVWPRTLVADFGEVAKKLEVGVGITTLDEERLRSLALSESGSAAVELMLADQELLRAHGLHPVLDCVNGYAPKEDPGLLRTDVCSFHADCATDEADTWLCTYHGASSEAVRNEDARRHVDVPETRAELLKHYGGEDDEGFLEYLNDNFYDLHYAPNSDAQPFSFGHGNLWRIAIDYPGSLIPPCVHRAPTPVPGQPPRLLLIA